MTGIGISLPVFAGRGETTIQTVIMKEGSPMGSGSTGSNKKLLIGILAAVAAVVVAVVVILVVKQGGFGGGDAQVGRIADHLPADTMFVAWSGEVGTFVEMAERVGLSSENLREMSFSYRDLLEKLGFDPLSRDGLERFGVDLSGPVGVALTPSQRAAVMVLGYIPISPGKSGVAAVRQVVEAVAPEGVEFAEGQENGRTVLWFRIAGGDHAVAACVEVEGGLFAVFPGKHRSKYEAEIENELRGLVASLTGTGGKLSGSADYAAAIKGCQDELFGALFLPEPARQLLMSGDDDLAALIPALADLSSAGAFVVEKGTGLHLTFTAVAKEGVAPFGRERELAALSFVPGQPLAGAHIAVDAGRLLTAFETAISADKWMWRAYKRGMEEVSEELKLPMGTRVDQVWNGELGFFINDLSENPEAVARGIHAFAGLADEALVTRILDSLMFKAGDMMTRGVAGDATVYRINADGVNVGVMVHKGRLWLSGSIPALEDIASGNKANGLDKDRSGKIAGVLKDSDNALAAYVDLETVMTRVPLLMSRRDRRDMEEVWPLLSQLDYGTFEVSQDGRSTVSTVSVYVKSGSFTDAVLKMAGTAFGLQMSKYTRRAKTAEAVDMLDKIYKGAADYYSTPRVSEYEASKLDCQFPADQGISPVEATCCGKHGGPDANGDGRCDANPDLWTEPTWSALKFQISEEHYCVYSFDQNDRTGSEAQFTANAHCDLDCDGNFSTFQRYGKGDPRASKGECSIVSAAALFTQNELE